MSPAGTCFGFEPRLAGGSGSAAATGFQYLRSGGATAGLDVAVGAAEPSSDARVLLGWEPPRHPFRARLHADARSYHLWIESAGWFTITPDAGRIAVPPEGDPVRREERLWGIPVLLCFLARGDHALHAAAVEIDGSAVLLAGPGRCGKTTLAAAFTRAGYRLLSEDLACIRTDDGVTSVVPGPAMLRVRRDVAGAIDIPGARNIGIGDDRVHYALDPKRRGSCEPVPLRAIFFLHPGDDDPSLHTVAPEDAVPNMWTLSFHLPDEDDLARCFFGASDLARSVPIFDVRRRMTLTELDRVVDLIASKIPAHV